LPSLDPSHIGRDEERRYEQLSPFELKARLIALAELHDPGHALRAGRGNPNWVATTAREAFFTFGQFAVSESRRGAIGPQLGGMARLDGIEARFEAFLGTIPDGPAADLLRGLPTEGAARSGRPVGAWLYELTDAVLGDNYPTPPRMLAGVERVVRHHLLAELYDAPSDPEAIELFAVEGGTAAMCDIFDTLAANGLLAPGDRVAIASPMFTPYLEIPKLPRYDYDVVELMASDSGGPGEQWQYPDAQIDLLADPSVRVLFIVNPSNPPSFAMRPETVARLVDVVTASNPSLMIVSDDVYGPFVPGYRSLLGSLPRNTIGVYSFSKYWGATGWRLGTVAVHRDNVFDELIRALPAAEQERLARRYSPISLDPASLSFMERLVADSRDVALNHTAGLSTPQQVQMALFALHDLADPGDTYRTALRDTLRNRLAELTGGLGVRLVDDPYRVGYYVELDVLAWAERHYGEAFAEFVQESYEPVDLVFRLAEQESVVLLAGAGFDAPEWSVRISLANLPDEDYRRIGESMRRVGAEYLDEYVAAGGTLPEDR
jgi:aspartate 4-decarboxylase